MNAWVGFRTGQETADTPGMRLWSTNRRQQPATIQTKRATVLKSAAEGASAVKSATKADTDTESDDTVSRAVSSTLDKDMFLQLLVTQMQYQDPLEPVDNSDMLAQLAQFSSLEQMNNMNEGLETLSGNIDQLNFISATSLLGQRITGVDDDGETYEGVVESVHLEGSIVYLTVDGEERSMAGVIGIKPENADTDTK